MAFALENEPELLHALYHSLTDREGLHGFLEKLTNAINGCAAQLLVVNRQPLRIDHLWYHGLSEAFINWHQENNMIAQDVVSNQAVKQAPGLFQSALPLLPDFQPDLDYSKWENEQDMLPEATFVLDSLATVLYSNSAARVLMTNERSLNLRDERISFTDHDLRAAFMRTSAQVVRSSMGQEGYCSETLFLKREGRAPLIFVIRPIENSELLAGGALVTVYEPDKRALPSAAHIAAYFDLTGAEAKVCEGLVRGQDPQSISEQLCRSVETVRSQIKHIFQKTGCSRQGELISQILSALLR